MSTKKSQRTKSKRWQCHHPKTGQRTGYSCILQNPAHWKHSSKITNGFSWKIFKWSESKVAVNIGPAVRNTFPCIGTENPTTISSWCAYTPPSHSTATTAVETALNKRYTPCLAHKEKRQAKCWLAFFRLVVSRGAVLLVRCTYTRETPSEWFREPCLLNFNRRVNEKSCCGGFSWLCRGWESIGPIL